jgi:rare lipoprotein A
MNRSFVTLCVLLLLAACGSPERSPRIGPGFENGKPVHPTVKMGDPYTVNGETYVPHYDPHYEEEGMASWYGPGFHGKSTANGERFDSNDMTAAHRTLPLPSMVRITHLSNGKSVVARVNDRGPFSDRRIIDVSKNVAQELGMIRSGIARVRVEYLARETESYIAQLKSGKSPSRIAWEQEHTPKATASSRKSSWFPSIVSDANAGEIAAADNSKASDSISSADLPAPESQKVSAAPSKNTVKTEHTEEQKSYLNSSFSVLEESEKGSAPIKTPAPAVESQAPAVISTAASASPSSAEAVADPKIIVQVGAFSSRENAEKIRRRFTSVAPTIISGTPQDKPSLYRVQLGPFLDRYSAETALSKARELGINDARLLSPSQ